MNFNFKIITDSCCDLPNKFIEKIDIAPMTLTFDGKSYKDLININKNQFYDLLTTCSQSPKSAAPSPADYLNKIKNNKNAFIITVSSALSSSFNNAKLTKEMCTDTISNKAVHVIDSLNASIGQGLAVLKLKELISKNIPEKKVIKHMNDYIKNLNTFFILEKMDNLINSGRLNKVIGKIVSVLNIKLIMRKTEEGTIELYKKVKGSKKAFNKLVDIIGKQDKNLKDNILGIAHYNCRNKAEKFRKVVEEKYNFEDIIITQMGPTIATYADEGALLISF
ncbi:MAG: DegV family protein [bacterium]